VTIDQKIVDRIRKLLSLGDTSKNNNENEAMLALERAHALMREHGVQMAQLSENDETEIEIGVGVWTDDERSQYDTWVSILAAATAQLFGCETVLYRGNALNKYRVRLSFIGEDTDLEFAKSVWPWLVKTCRRMAVTTLGSGWTSSHRSFAEAFSTRVYNRAKELAEQDDQAPKTQDDQRYAMVLAMKDEAIELFMKKHYPNLKKGRKRGFRGDYDYKAASAGAQAGDKVNLNFRRQINNGGGTPQLSG
jgi:hypothetical protein